MCVEFKCLTTAESRTLSAHPDPYPRGCGCCPKYNVASSLFVVAPKAFGHMSHQKDVRALELKINGILKADTKDKVNTCTFNKQFQSAFTREADSDLPSKRVDSFSMGDVTADPKGVAKLLDELKVHKASGPNGLKTTVLEEYSS